ncbi:RNA polymerase sigma-70 factor, ECF subfamily [Anaeromicropila populeti]|uniref:RNA polymerase sigma-70 factor, ECF subfamily n=2 Tax=Anaeromicropila populeti TaxID=37658 RepID=A0A1I6IDL8_9FIRM|nr:RNA polymerase sigma-70 factor, ECF subfamily [Anaeromicropila populeti]
MDLEEQYYKIFRYCCLKVKRTAIAEDLTQETFLRYFSQSTYIELGKQTAYLYTIARNLCNDYFSKQIYWEELKDDVPYTEGDTDMKLTVRQAVEMLPKDLQEIVLLRFVNEVPVKDIAAFMELSRFAVNRRIKDALKRLKEVLREEDFS